MPAWLTVLAWISIGLAGLCAAAIAADVWRRPQRMKIMNVVWPVTALWSGPVGLWAYLRYGRAGTQGAERAPFPVKVGKAATHCGAGCTLGDLGAEWFALAVPISLGGFHIFGTWIYDYVLAFAFGIAFQYLTIRPMTELSRREALMRALKADTLSLTSWQVGMYGWMALATFVLIGHEIPKTSPVFWLMMQVAMFCGFAASYPVNWWLLRKKIKEPM